MASCVQCGDFTKCNGDYEVIVSDTNNLEYIMSLIKQALQIERNNQ
ncbi:hypothetical protein FIA58_004595 [Flavobacterium jejuense]|uniref:Uncharacterized protein n=1 Tax=Flavobacterium jejuense TaxID=1544455 RepID=A0ABX0IMD1_9FLAO|nr:hypothetical protein [Flavobacterium jejuense]NHN24950.1 hypothetical protein [Flavobacterium jejuense]